MLSSQKHRNMYSNIDKSGHIESLVYGLTIGFEPK
nr:MAG TPA: hypothetical protein [Caudoviricetes sp.]